MQGWFWSDTHNGLLAFTILSVLAAGAAWAIGQSFAASWTPLWRLLPAVAVLSAGVQFLHFALYQENLTSLHYYLVTLAITALVAVLSYTARRSQQMATQYSWAYRKSFLGWAKR